MPRYYFHVDVGKSPYWTKKASNSLIPWTLKWRQHNARNGPPMRSP
jgi:hypothetical protein